VIGGDGDIRRRSRILDEMGRGQRDRPAAGRALGGSIVAHVVVGALLVVAAKHRSTPPVERAVTVELADVPAVAFDITRLDVVDLDGGGGDRPSPSVTARPRVAMASPRRVTRMPERAPRSVRAELGELALDEPLDGHGRDLGASRGAGGLGRGLGGLGRGVGPGHGADDGILTAPMPPPPAASKARPPKLIYPTRERDVGEGELFVARVTIDRDGYVVGARLIHGVGGHRDDRAEAQIFRFRYRPALDDDGRPTPATLDQPFLVQ